MRPSRQCCPAWLRDRGGTGPDLRRLCGEFAGAWPCLRLIAASSGITDPLDRAVVEAYWVGNRPLENVRVGCARGHTEPSLHVLDSCRISWGQAVTRDPLVVSGSPLTWDGNTLLWGVSAVSGDNIWAVGTTDYTSTLIVHWNGKSWR